MMIVRSFGNQNLEATALSVLCYVMVSPIANDGITNGATKKTAGRTATRTTKKNQESLLRPLRPCRMEIEMRLQTGDS